MSTSRIAAVVTGAAALALAVVTVTGPAVPDEHWGTRGGVVNALGIVTFVAMALAVELLPAALPLARIGRLGVRGTQVGLGMMTVESVASEVHGGNILGPVFMLGLLLTTVGFVAVALDGLSRPGARWLAALPLAAMLVGIGAGDHGGFAVLGLTWGALAFSAPGRPGGKRAAQLA